jgi:hypothetical protein
VGVLDELGVLPMRDHLCRGLLPQRNATRVIRVRVRQDDGQDGAAIDRGQRLFVRGRSGRQRGVHDHVSVCGDNHERVAVRDANLIAADLLGGSHMNAAAEIDHARLRGCRARAE